MPYLTKKNYKLAPVLIFAHRRPRHLRKVLDALARDELANRSSVKIFIDGPNNLIEAFQTYWTYLEARKNRPFHKLQIIKRKNNYGLAKSIVTGVRQTLCNHEKVIVLEDDTVPLKGFLEYMNTALVKYEKDQRIFQISGFCPFAEIKAKRVQFSRLTTSWGWGTWKRAWKNLKMKIKIPKEFEKKKYSFDFDNSYPFFSLLKDAALGRSQSWAIRWYFTCFRLKGRVVYPPTSFIKNIGFDGTGEHSKKTQLIKKNAIPVCVKKLTWPCQIHCKKNTQIKIKKFLRDLQIN